MCQDDLLCLVLNFFDRDFQLQLVLFELQCETAQFAYCSASGITQPLTSASQPNTYVSTGILLGIHVRNAVAVNITS